MVSRDRIRRGIMVGCPSIMTRCKDNDRISDYKDRI